jgi:hypothetical protein
LWQVAVDDLGAVGYAVAFVAESNKRDQTILNKDIPPPAIGSIAVLET